MRFATTVLSLFFVACGGRLLEAPDDASADVAPESSGPACPLVPSSDPQNPTTGCSVVGTWIITDGDTMKKALIAFDGDGAFYGGDLGTDLSQTYAFDGPYRIENGTLHLLDSCGLGLTIDCHFDAAFKMQFSSDCSFVKLVEVFDNCTGAREYFRGTPTLTRQ